MLAQLSIRNFALIESADIDFPSGFIALTGETGSGKSILLGALNLILGERADYSVIRDSEKKTIVEGVFHLGGNYQSWFETEDIDWSDETVIRREITAQGKSRAFINDSPVQLSQLKELAGQLIYIHSQHQTLELKDPQFQLNLIDAFSGLLNETAAYRKCFSLWKKSSEKLEELRKKFAGQSHELDFLNYQIDELLQLDLHKTDYQAYETELKRADQLDDLREAFGALSVGIADENASLSQLRSIHAHVSRWKSADPVLASLAERLGSVIIELDDISAEASDTVENLQLDPERQSFLTTAVDRFNTLLRKHHAADQSELKRVLSEMEEKVGGTDSLSEEIAQLAESTEKAFAEVQSLSGALHKKRVKGAEALRKYLLDLLKDLKLADSQLEFALAKTEQPDRNGSTKVQLMFSANRGMAPKPIEKSASGGELSRLMLAVQSAMSSKKSLPTLILDEIDTGVSGEVAARIGNLLHNMGTNMQLMAITHLPQVAARGQFQFEVAKSSKGNETHTSIRMLAPEERKTAIAKLISGELVSEASLQNAAVLLGEA